MDEKKQYPLTHPQKGIWYTEKFYEKTSINNISATLRIKGKIDFNLLEKAINMVIEKNDAMRIRIFECDEIPYQYVSDFEFKNIDVFDFSNKEIEKLYEWDQKEARIPFDVIESPLYYFALLKIDDDTTGIYIRIHHLISDAWSLTQSGDNFVKYYRKLKNNEILPKEKEPSYIDFIETEEKYINSKRYIKDGEYWNAKFSDLPELTTLKVRKTNNNSIEANRKAYVLPKRLNEKIRGYCNITKSSVFGLFLSALAIYINRVTSKTDIVLGVPVLNRKSVKEKNTVGMFISTVPLRIKIEEDMDFIAFSEYVTREWMSTLKHQRYPYDVLLSEMRKKFRSNESMYDIVLSYQNAKFLKDEEQKDKQMARWHFNGYQRESLFIHINDREDDENIILDYDYLTDLFYLKEVEFIHDHLIRILWHALDNPAKNVTKIDMISENEKNRILYKFNNTDADYDKHKTIHKIFEEQVEKTPDNIAAVFGNCKITYRELNNKANQLARTIRDKGIKSDSIVGILLDKSIDVLVAILGVLKAGGAYLPIDSDYPNERVKYILEDSNSEAVITNNSFINKIDFKNHILNLSNDSTYNNDIDNLENINEPCDLMYIIYTSGSTGEPNGVMIEHRNVVRLMFNDKFKFNFDENDIWTMFHSYNFDFSVWEMYGALLYGGKLVIIPKEISRSPKDFLAILKTEKVTVLNQVPIIFYNLIKEELQHNDKELRLKYVIFGGDSLKPIMLKPFKKKYPQTKLINMYGITETTVHVTYKEITDKEIIQNKNNIGKPIPTLKTYILDRYQNIVPIGVMGEICVAGDGVSRGYLNKPELTSHRFVENPYIKGEIIYRSGDYARWYPKGEMEYLGRIDYQVKIHGFRIELGEIENKLLEYMDIYKALVIDKKNGKNNTYLCAYIVCNKKINISELKKYLSAKMPSYMIPSYFVILDKFPLTSNGKIARTSLPEVDQSAVLNTQYVEPQSKTEKLFAEIWSKVLSIQKIGRNDNIFDLGGDSLNVIQFQSYVQNYKYQISILDIYKYPKISDLSDYADNIKNKITYSENAIVKCAEPCYTEVIKTVSQPISDMILMGKFPQLDSAALTYIPDSVLDNKEVLTKINNPVLYSYVETSFGNIGVFALPLLASELYVEKEKLISLCTDAIGMAYRLGAKVISLTGLIPSATDYGYAVIDKLDKNDNVKISTGHTTTSAAVILSVERILMESERDLTEENVCVLGLGSIGTTVIKLILSILPHPASIRLCDIEQKSDILIKLKQELEDEYGYKNKIDVVFSKGAEVPEEVYDSTLIIGATSVENILNIEKVKSGTLIIDDSGPHCFSKIRAINRMLEFNDILFTEGGVLESSQDIHTTVQVNELLDYKEIEKYQQGFINKNEITGCILSGLLSKKFVELEPVLGNIKIVDCLKHYLKLKQLGYKGASLHCDDFIIPLKCIKEFKYNYSKKEKQGKSIKESV